MASRPRAPKIDPCMQYSFGASGGLLLATGPRVVCKDVEGKHDTKVKVSRRAGIEGASYECLRGAGCATYRGRL